MPRIVEARASISDEIRVDHWLQFDDGRVAAEVAKQLGRSERFWQAVAAHLGGARASDEAAALLPLEGAGRRLVASHIEFAALRGLDLGDVTGDGERIPADIGDPEVRALIQFELMNRVPTISPTGSRRRRHLRELEYAETLELLAGVLDGRCLYPGCDEPPGDRHGEPVYHRDDGRRRSAARSWCCGTHATWEATRGKGTAAVKRVRDLLRVAAKVPHETYADWSERDDAMRKVFGGAG
jgi:hypothetical protein